MAKTGYLKILFFGEKGKGLSFCLPSRSWYSFIDPGEWRDGRLSRPSFCNFLRQRRDHGPHMLLCARGIVQNLKSELSYYFIVSATDVVWIWLQTKSGQPCRMIHHFTTTAHSYQNFSTSVRIDKIEYTALRNICKYNMYIVTFTTFYC